MSGGTQADRIQELLAAHPGLNDDEIAAALQIEPRQTVNQICRRLAEKGSLIRERGQYGKIINTLSSGSVSSAWTHRPPMRTGATAPMGCSLVPTDLTQTLVVIPCSGKKRDEGTSGLRGDCFVDHLPAELALELHRAREVVHSKVLFDETNRIPAWQRYDGALYRAARQAIANLITAGAHVVILSGGYGVILASEPIGNYDTPLKTGWWPRQILERTLVGYARGHGIASVRGFASETSAYRQILERIPWSTEGIGDALLLSPEPQLGGLRKSPASLGEAVASLAEGSLVSDWQSSYGLRLNVRRL